MSVFTLSAPIRISPSGTVGLNATPSVGYTAAPTTSALTGVSLAYALVETDYTVTLDAPAERVYTITWLQTGSATIVPTTSTIAVGQSSATAGYTWPSAGVGSVDYTISPSLSRTGRPRAVTISLTPISASWATRSTLLGTVWAHNFALDTEVSAHMQGTAGQSTGAATRRYVDNSGNGWLEQIILGAKLAAPFTAGGATIQIDNARFWPDPATDGSFYFMVHKADRSLSKNLFLCTARSGTALTVSYVDKSGNSAFASTPQSYAVGDYAGNEASSLQWVRTFAALPAGENGLGADDPADGGNVPLRSRSGAGAYAVPFTSMWQYGFYGAASVQATWPNWTPWVGGTTYGLRGVSNGAAAKYRLWDGAEFWMQFTVVHDPVFWEVHRLPVDNMTPIWGRKTWAFQSETSSLNQIVADIDPAGFRWGIPSTDESPFKLLVHKAAQTVGLDDWARVHKSVQLNSAWDVAPYYADITVGNLPSAGCPTPDGSAAWEYKPGHRLTFSIRIKPGRSGYAETEITVKVADLDSPGYDGTYKTLLDATDVKITYSGSGDYAFPDGAFTSATVTTMDALPGYQSFWLMGYLNLFQSFDLPPALKSYYIRMTEVIFNRQQEIPPPAVPVTIAAGSIVNLPATNTRTDLDPALDPLANPNYPGVPPWHTPGMGYWSHMTDYCGAAFAPSLGTMGTYLQYGGAGHSAENPLFWIGFDVATMTWKRIGNRPLPTNGLQTWPTVPGGFDATWGDWDGGSTAFPEAFRQPGVIAPEGSHTRNSFIYRTPEKAINSNGQIMVSWGATGVTSSTGIATQHCYDLDTMLWSRNANRVSGAGQAAGGLVYHAAHDVVLGPHTTSSTSANHIDFLDCATGLWTRRTMTAGVKSWVIDSTSFSWTDGSGTVWHIVAEPVGVTMSFWGVRVDQVIAGTATTWTDVTVSAASWPVSGDGNTGMVNWAYCPADGCYYAVNHTHGSNKLWKLTPPANGLISGTWNVSEQTLTGTTLDARTHSGASGTSYDYSRLHWCRALSAFLWTPDYMSGNIQAVRPAGV